MVFGSDDLTFKPRGRSPLKLTFKLVDTGACKLNSPWDFHFMTRSDLVTALADRFPQLLHRDAESAVNIILGAMSDVMLRGLRIEIRGFGSFSVKQRAAHIGRNPRIGSSVNIPPRRVPHFKVGKSLRECIDQSAPK